MPISDYPTIDVRIDQRLWRARRRHDHIDAVLHHDGQAWVLRFLHNDRNLLTWPYPDEASARAEAAVRLRALQRAGWNVHW